MADSRGSTLDWVSELNHPDAYPLDLAFALSLALTITVTLTFTLSFAVSSAGDGMCPNMGWLYALDGFWPGLSGTVCGAVSRGQLPTE